MSFKQLKQAIASGKITLDLTPRPVSSEESSLRGMSAGEIAELDLSLRLSFLQAALLGTQYDNWAVVTDESYWEPEVNYQLLADSGVDAFLTRAYGPTSWEEGKFSPKPDKCYFTKMQQMKATGKARGGYVIHNPWEMVDNPDSAVYAQRQIQQWKEVFYDDYLPDFLCLDWEVPYCYRNGKQVFMPGGNQVKTVRWTLDSMLKEWKKTTWLYSRVTYFNEWGGADCKTMLDNFNAGGTRAHLHLAYYLNAIAKLPSIRTPEDFKALLPAYSGSVRTYLEYGSTDVSTRLWQLGPIAHAACPTGKVDWNIIPLTPDQFNALVGHTPSTPPIPPGDPTQYATKAELALLQAQVEQINQRLRDAAKALMV